jgi:hypothetical protein
VSFLSNVEAGRGFGVTSCVTALILDRASIVWQGSFRDSACYI